MTIKIAIVGGGITGCILALEASKFSKVTLFETKKKLGGVLSDVSFSQKKYYSSCQYLDPYAEWYKKYLIKEKFKILHFTHEKYSFTDLFGKNTLSRNIALPTYDKKTLFKLNESAEYDLRDRLYKYPAPIRKGFIGWIKNLGLNIEKLSIYSTLGMGFRRVYLKNMIKFSKFNKLHNTNFDDKFGLTDKELGLGQLYASLPEEGYENFFDHFENVLKKNKVEIINRPVRSMWNNNKLTLITMNKSYGFNKIFWTGNPTGLIKSFNDEQLDSLNIDSQNFCFELEGTDISNFYVQVFSKKNFISRIFVYKIKKKLKMTVETNSLNIKKQEVINFCNYIFYKLKKNIKILDNSFCFNKKKYIIFSKKDEKVIFDFNQKTKNTNLVQGFWLNHSRNEKIRLNLNELKKYKSL